MHDLFVVTHPQATHSRDGRVGGWFDSTLTEKGRRDAELIGGVLADRRRVGRRMRIVSSDLERCAETARIVADRVECSVTLDARLREISFGDAEGRPTAWLAEREIPAPDDDRLDHRGPVPGAETRREVATRVSESVAELMREQEYDHVVVTHGYAQTFVITTWLGIPVESVGFATFSPRPGSISHLQRDDYWRNRTLVAMADTSHLR